MNHVYIAKTYSTVLSGGITLRLTKSEGAHECIEVNAEWANGEPMEHFHELTLNLSDMGLVSDLFRAVAMGAIS